MSNGERKYRIEQALKQYLNPINLEVVDDSNSHKGHFDAPDSGESHYNVTIASTHFIGMNRIERERIVYKILSEEFKTGLHALSLKLSER